MMPERVTLSPSRLVIASAQSSSVVAVLGELRRVEPGFLDVVGIDLGLQAHQVHRDHEDLVVVFRIARRLDRELAEVGEIEARLLDRDRRAARSRRPWPSWRACRPCPSRSRAPCRWPTAARTLVTYCSSGTSSILIWTPLSLWASLKASIILRPDLAVGGGEPAPVDDLGGALRARRAAAEPERRARRGRPGRERATGHLPTGRHAQPPLVGRARRPDRGVARARLIRRRSFHRRRRGLDLARHGLGSGTPDLPTAAGMAEWRLHAQSMSPGVIRRSARPMRSESIA